MASLRKIGGAREGRPPAQRENGNKQPQGITKENPQQIRKSARLEVISRFQQSEKRKPGQRSSLPTAKIHPSLPPSQRRKRLRGAEPSVAQTSGERSRKRLRALPADTSLGQTFSQGAVDCISASQNSYISHWAEEKDWPQDFFQQNTMNHLLARRRSTATLRRKRSEGSFTTSTTSSDQKPADEKNAPYKNPSYRTLLETQGDSYMGEYELGIREECETLCQTLLQTEQIIPIDTIFRDDVFRTTCNRLQGKNEARIIKDLTPLLVPSLEPLATLGAKHLDIAVESVNEGWNNCVPVTRPRPQPDYAAGFGRSAFSDDQLSKLQPFIGDPSDLSYFMATYYMHFPFLTCEVKCGTAGLDIADRQNAHSMTVAMKGIVELFKGVGREHELHRRILGFSFSHDHESIRIWGHYPVVSGDRTTFWRQSIRKFDFTERKGSEKWAAYTFTKNVYDIWLTPHFKLICSAIDDLTLEQDLPTSQQSKLLASEPSEPLLPLEDQNFTQEMGDQSNQSGRVDLRPITPDTSTQSAAKKIRKKKTT